MNELLTYDPERRPSAGRALRHPYFTKESPSACRPEMIQTFPEIRNDVKEVEAGGGRVRGGGGMEAGSGYVFDFGEVGGGEGEARRKRRKQA